MDSTPPSLPGLQQPLSGQRDSTVPFLTQNVPLAWITAVGLLAVVLLGVYADSYLILVIWRRKRKTMRLLTEFYADQDGEATAESIKEASAAARNTHRLTGACVGLGGVVSIAKMAVSLELQRAGVPVVDSLQIVIWVSELLYWMNTPTDGVKINRHFWACSVVLCFSVSRLLYLLQLHCALRSVARSRPLSSSCS